MNTHKYNIGDTVLHTDERTSKKTVLVVRLHQGNEHLLVSDPQHPHRVHWVKVKLENVKPYEPNGNPTKDKTKMNTPNPKQNDKDKTAKADTHANGAKKGDKPETAAAKPAETATTKPAEGAKAPMHPDVAKAISDSAAEQAKKDAEAKAAKDAERAAKAQEQEQKKATAAAARQAEKDRKAKEKADKLAAKEAAKAARLAARPKREPHPCLCGCGTIVKSSFAPGHDAKLHSRVLAAIKANQPIAVTKAAAEWLDKKSWSAGGYILSEG